MTAIEKLLADRNWYDDILGAWHHHGKPPLAEARAEHESLLARIKELESQLEIACHVKATDKVKFDWQILETLDNQRERIEELEADNEAMKRVVEAAREWHGWGEMYNDCINLHQRVQEYELSR